MRGTITPYRSRARAGSDGFEQLLRAEWTKFRTVRGWVIAILGAALLTMLISLLGPLGSRGPGGANPPAGPGGQAVTDTFYFVSQPLDGNGSLTIRVTSLTGVRSLSAGLGPQPWAKAGLIMKDGTKPGSPYAAIMVTPSHGVRMQYDFTHDMAGQPGAVSAASPRWLRLTRSAETLTGYESADGTHWAKVGTAAFAGLPSTLQAGLFVTSPQYSQIQGEPGGTSQNVAATLATAVFDHASRQGDWPRSAWRGRNVGNGASAAYAVSGSGGFKESGGRFTVAGSGDIAPYVATTDIVEESLSGALVGLLVVIVLGALFITPEYRRGIIRITLTASPRRGRVLAAKAMVIGCITFVAGLAATVTAFPIAQRLMRSHSSVGYPLTSLTELRAVVGTAALLAIAAVLALAAGVVLRSSAGAVATIIVLLVLPEFLTLGGLPAGLAQWLLRVTPAAAFAVQESVTHYSQVNVPCVPASGCYPLAPWAGFAVLCAYAVAALILAAFLLRRRDA